MADNYANDSYLKPGIVPLQRSPGAEMRPIARALLHLLGIES
jgi:hypothetical protein